MADGISAGVVSRILDAFPVVPVLADEQMLENVRSAVSRGLPGPAHCRPHEHVMSVAAGGPSLSDTWGELSGVICAVNGSLNFLLERDVKPWAVGCFDPRPHMADTLGDPRDDIFYFLGSTCHPSVFEKFAGKQVICWHPLGMPGMGKAIGDRVGIGGGTTMGLRWMTLGHFMGFRKFKAHGLDSSFRGKSTHAYPDWRDNFEAQEIDGYKTSLNFIQQVQDWFEMKAMFDGQPDPDKVSIELFGDGLLQHAAKKHEAELDQLRNLPRRPDSKPLNIALVATGDYLGRGEEYVRHLMTGVAKHFEGNAKVHIVREGPASWWAKLSLFEPGRFPAGERVVYFDLDTIITGDLSDLFNYDGPFMALRDWWQPGQLNSSVMSWTAGECDHIWTNWVKAGRPTDDPRGDQAWITSQMPGAVKLQDILPGQFVSFKAHCLGGVPDGVRAICFHGEPRPHQTELWTTF